jgi:hypothetical protein
MGKTYLCGKIGKSVKFNPRTWTGLGGDCETPELFRKMAVLNPADTFIIIGRNDVDTHRIELNLPPNLVNVYSDATKDERLDVNYLVDRLKNIKVDGCFLVAGPVGNINVPNKSWKRLPLKDGIKEYAKSLYVFENYVAPIYTYLDETNTPWVLLANDPRYTEQGNDLINQPKKVLSQFDETIKMKTFDNWVDQNYVWNNIPAVYAGMEKMFLIDKKIPETFNKTKKFMVVLNEGNNGVTSRYAELKKYVLDYIDDVEIYGKWDEETVKDDSRFKGSVKFNELQEMLPAVKYSFMISIKDGWVTMKIWELIAHGIIPFMHPNYDTQKHCKVPDFIRISSPSELHEKIEQLEADPELYKKILDECLAAITDGDLSGDTISKMILSETPAVNKSGEEFGIIDTLSDLDDW